MNNRARMIERARKMYPKRRRLFINKFVMSFDTDAFQKALKQTAEALKKFADAWEAHLHNGRENEHENHQE